MKNFPDSLKKVVVEGLGCIAFLCFGRILGFGTQKVRDMVDATNHA